MENEVKKMQLIMLRDCLFDKYLETYDKHQQWINGNAKLVHGRVKDKDLTRKQIAAMIGDQLTEISADLRELDEKICKRSTPEETFTTNKEIY